MDSNARGPAQSERACAHRTSQRGSVCSHQLGAVGQGPPQLVWRRCKRAPNVAGLHKARPRAGAQLACTWSEARAAGLVACACVPEPHPPRHRPCTTAHERALQHTGNISPCHTKCISSHKACTPHLPAGPPPRRRLHETAALGAPPAPPAPAAAAPPPQPARPRGCLLHTGAQRGCWPRGCCPRRWHWRAERPLLRP